MKQRYSFQQMVLDQLDINRQKKKNLDKDWIIDLNIEQKTIKFLDDLEYDGNFLDTTSEA